MGHKKDNDELRTARHLDTLQWETAKELGLEKDVTLAGEKLDPQNLGIKGSKARRQVVKLGEEALQDEGARKTELNLNDGW
ncbi:MAG: Small acid-soluble spore protein alpha/beta type [Clostridia bacterium 62_21]|nr:MAG: Small acid-soluble spore protein alpha/beta type [Clostridia bacterium 62_21]HAG06793.1 acid-soluble spore protein [Peptococcaceae bacterium]